MVKYKLVNLYPKRLNLKINKKYIIAKHFLLAANRQRRYSLYLINSNTKESKNILMKISKSLYLLILMVFFESDLLPNLFSESVKVKFSINFDCSKMLL